MEWQRSGFKVKVSKTVFYMSVVQSVKMGVPFAFMCLIILNPVLSLYSDRHTFITITKMSFVLLYVILLFSPGLLCFPDL